MQQAVHAWKFKLSYYPFWHFTTRNSEDLLLLRPVSALLQRAALADPLVWVVEDLAMCAVLLDKLRLYFDKVASGLFAPSIAADINGITDWTLRPRKSAFWD